MPSSAQRLSCEDRNALHYYHWKCKFLQYITLHAQNGSNWKLLFWLTLWGNSCFTHLLHMFQLILLQRWFKGVRLKVYSFLCCLRQSNEGPASQRPDRRRLVYNQVSADQRRDGRNFGSQHLRLLHQVFTVQSGDQISQVRLYFRLFELCSEF